MHYFCNRINYGDKFLCFLLKWSSCKVQIHSSQKRTKPGNVQLETYAGSLRWKEDHLSLEICSKMFYLLEKYSKILDFTENCKYFKYFESTYSTLALKHYFCYLCVNLFGYSEVNLLKLQKDRWWLKHFSHI